MQTHNMYIAKVHAAAPPAILVHAAQEVKNFGVIRTHNDTGDILGCVLGGDDAFKELTNLSDIFMDATRQRMWVLQRESIDLPDSSESPNTIEQTPSPLPPAGEVVESLWFINFQHLPNDFLAHLDKKGDITIVTPTSIYEPAPVDSPSH
jgi:hypothetical protein